jgi:hypothetical protein
MSATTRHKGTGMSKQLCPRNNEAREGLACKKRQCCCGRTEAVAGHGDALRWKLTGPRSKPLWTTTFRSRGKGKTRGREGEREATVGAAAEEEEQRGREEATTEHALDSILIAPRSSPLASAVAAPPAAGGGNRDETRRGVGGRRGERTGSGQSNEDLERRHGRVVGKGEREREREGRGRQAARLWMGWVLSRPRRAHTFCVEIDGGGERGRRHARSYDAFGRENTLSAILCVPPRRIPTQNCWYSYS